MAQNPNTLRQAPGAGGAPQQREQADHKELREVTRGVDSAVLETTDGGVDGVDVQGQVSETLRTSAGENMGGTGGKAKGDQSAQAVIDLDTVRAQLLAQAPAAQVMRRQVKREIEREINYLHRQAMKMVRSREVNFFEMANMLRKIRELKGILLDLVKASVENMKTLWLRFVHGIM